MNAAELLVHCLENEGVQYVFGIPGEENIHIMDALSRSRIRFVPTRHEQGAAFMADATSASTSATPTSSLTRAALACEPAASSAPKSFYQRCAQASTPAPLR
ncbi:MAG TPA: thiamine pyrophosphate-binding protein [Vicinamibacterales bacterium]|nr:thiamine pyrophosphate-binding protein [Vicinamibacterales bacterium]